MAAVATAFNFIIGADRKLRPIWRAILWALLTVFVAMPLLGMLLDLVIGPEPPGQFAFSPANLSLAEGFNFACALIVTAAFAFYERRRIDSYGMPVSSALKSPTWEGFALGVVQPAIVAFAMIAYGAMQVRSLAQPGAASLVWALARTPGVRYK